MQETKDEYSSCKEEKMQRSRTCKAIISHTYVDDISFCFLFTRRPVPPSGIWIHWTISPFSGWDPKRVKFFWRQVGKKDQMRNENKTKNWRNNIFTTSRKIQFAPACFDWLLKDGTNVRAFKLLLHLSNSRPAWLTGVEKIMTFQNIFFFILYNNQLSWSSHKRYLDSNEDKVQERTLQILFLSG